jgi:hypothetical protein
VAIRTGGKTMPKGGIVFGHYGRLWDYEAEMWKDRLPQDSSDR